MQIEIYTEGSAADAIDRLIASMGDFSQLVPKLGELAMDSQKQDIEESRSPAGKKYPDLQHPRPQRKGIGIPDMWGHGFVRHHMTDHPYGEKPLLDTTNMYQSIHYEERVVQPGLGEAWAGPSIEQAPYFPYQNQGTSRGIPERPFIGLRREDRDTIAEWTLQHILSSLP